MANSLKGPYKIAGYELESPLLNAAGSINGPSVDSLRHEGEILGKTAIGGITYGSFTIPSQEGNAAKYGDPVLQIDETRGMTWNSMGLPNIGLLEAVKIAPELMERSLDAGKIVIYSGSPTNAPEYGTSVEQATKLAYELLDTPVDLVEINVSCPNVVTEGGGRKPILGYDLESMKELTESLLSQVGQDPRLGVKLPPYLTDEELAVVPDLAKLFRATRVFNFLVTSNTIPNSQPTPPAVPLSVPGGAGGLSGEYTAPTGREQLTMWRNEMAGEIDIVSTEGVSSGKEMAERLRLGAVATGGVTFLWRRNSHDWPQAIDKMLTEFAREIDRQPWE